MILLCAMLALSDTQVVARTIYAEAGGEGTQGIEAVAGVIGNRAKLKNISPRQVCLARKQFSCWRGIIKQPKPSPTYSKIIILARKLVKEGKTSPFTHYYAHRVCNPKWAASLKNKTVIGNHTFGTI